jgi:endonuclease YncB( thermonuclease family)
VTGGVAPGWYPDYEAPPGHQRYWNGERWTERRTSAPEVAGAGVEAQVRRFAPWLLAAVAVLVAVGVAVLVVGDDQTARSSIGSSPPPAASTPGPPASEQTTPDHDAGPARRTWQVDAAVDGSTLRLSNGAEVLLVGIADSCGDDALAKMAVGHRVTLTRRGPDKNADDRLLRYVERDGVDVGKRLIQRGWAKASDQPNPRRAIYRRIDERSPDRC